MKNLCTTIILLSFVISIFSQAPAGFKYQAVARNSSGQLIVNTQVNIQIAIIKGSISDTPVYIESFSPVSNNFGIINLNIGNGTILSGNFTNIDWGADSFFLKVWLNGVEMGTSQLLSVPYAMYSKKAESLTPNAITGNEIAFNGWDKDMMDDIREFSDEFIATAFQISFTLSQTPSTNSKVKMYINGIRIRNSAYVNTGTTLTYIPANNGSYALTAGDRIQFDYSY